MTTLSLYRALLREAKHVSDYNFRTYSIRRVKAGFHKNRHLQGQEANDAIQEGQKQLELLNRVRVMGNLYPSASSVMDAPSV